MVVDDDLDEDTGDTGNNRMANDALLDSVMVAMRGAVDDHFHKAEQTLKEQLNAAAKVLASNHEKAAVALAQKARKVTAEVLSQASGSKGASGTTGASDSWVLPGSMDGNSGVLRNGVLNLPEEKNAKAKTVMEEKEEKQDLRSAAVVCTPNAGTEVSVAWQMEIVKKDQSPSHGVDVQDGVTTIVQSGKKSGHEGAGSMNPGSSTASLRRLDSAGPGLTRQASQRGSCGPHHAAAQGGIAAFMHAKGPANLFADAEEMKRKVRDAIGEKVYDVTDYYRDTGIAQYIARHTVFDHFTLGVIGLNALWIGIDTDYNEASLVMDAEPGFQFVENFFCAYFFGEWVIRTGAFRKTRDSFRDGWYVFDGVLALLMVFETWVMTVVIVFASGDGGANTERLGNASLLKLLRLLRLTRMARMARLMHVVPELMTLVKGMAVATRSVFFTLCLLIIFLYVFGVAFTLLCKGTYVGTVYFSSVSVSMNTLLLHGALLEECPTVINMAGEESFFLRALFLLFVLLASLTVMNMLVGVIVEVVSVVSAVEKETLRVTFFRQRMEEIISEFSVDEDGNGQISKDEFMSLLENPEAARSLRDVGVDVIGLIDYQDFLFQEDEEFNFGTFVEVVLSLRGGNNATVKDMVDLRKVVQVEGRRRDEKMETILAAVHSQGRKLSKLQSLKEE
jgi:hypothetical protein